MHATAATFAVLTAGRANTHWMPLEGCGEKAIIENARYFDITLIGQYDIDRGDTAFAIHPDLIALQSGRPIIIVPRRFDQPLGDRAVVAWDGQCAAARALSDAMQILETKEQVSVLSVLDEGRIS